MAYSQENKTILITGATSGIGKAAACYLASLGAKVVASARNMEKGSDLLSAYKEQYPNGQGTIELVEGDFSSSSLLSSPSQLSDPRALRGESFLFSRRPLRLFWRRRSDRRRR